MSNYTRNDLTKDINAYMLEIDEYNKDLEILEECEDLDEIFQYFEDEYEIEIYDYENRNFMDIFHDLDYEMGWSEFYYGQKEYFENLNENDKLFYLRKFYRKFNLEYSDYYSLEDSFKFLQKKFNFYKKVKQFITDFVGENIENRFEKLEDLEEIILKYRLRTADEIPETIMECKEIIEEELFVNIYDFERGNNKCFNTLEELSEYTINNELFYPLAEAKETFAYKVLLKELIWE